MLAQDKIDFNSKKVELQKCVSTFYRELFVFSSEMQKTKDGDSLDRE